MMLFLGGLQLLVLGILGEYVGSVFDEAKRRPLYLVDEVIRSQVPREDDEPVSIAVSLDS